MTYLIGGHNHGQVVEQKHIDLKSHSILLPYGPRTGMTRDTESYIRTQLSLDGEVKTFYILSTKKPTELKEQILYFWDKVLTDIYVI